MCLLVANGEAEVDECVLPVSQNKQPSGFIETISFCNACKHTSKSHNLIGWFSMN